jgi:hypothetical protein
MHTRRLLLIVSAVVLAAAGVAAWLVLRPSGTATSGADPGVEACRMMAEDKRNGTRPDAARGQREMDAMARSGNADLRRAAAMLTSTDVSEAMSALGPLYAGCRAVGVPVG